MDSLNFTTYLALADFPKQQQVWSRWAPSLSGFSPYCFVDMTHTDESLCFWQCGVKSIDEGYVAVDYNIDCWEIVNQPIDRPPTSLLSLTAEKAKCDREGAVFGSISATNDFE